MSSVFYHHIDRLMFLRVFCYLVLKGIFLCMTFLNQTMIFQCWVLKNSLLYFETKRQMCDGFRMPDIAAKIQLQTVKY